MKLRRGDIVRILRGKDRGKTGQILAVVPKQSRLLVEGVNVVKKHVRARRAGEKGQRVSVASPLPYSNAQLVCPACKRGTRVQRRRAADGLFERVCRHCHEVIPNKK